MQQRNSGTLRGEVLALFIYIQRELMNINRGPTRGGREAIPRGGTFGENKE